MATKKAQYNVDNGNGYDTYHFETSEEMITGAYQRLTDTGFRKLPGGLILQWGSYYATNLQAPGTVEGTLHFPIAFPNKCFSVVASPNYRSRGDNYNIDVAVSLYEDSTKHTSFDFVFKVEDIAQWGGILWYAIGY